MGKCSLWSFFRLCIPVDTVLWPGHTFTELWGWNSVHGESTCLFYSFSCERCNKWFYSHSYVLLLSSIVLYSLQQSKIEDHLDEAINVLQRHASGQGGPGLAEMHSLLSSGLGLPPGFTTAALGLASRLPGLVRLMNSRTGNRSTKDQIKFDIWNQSKQWEWHTCFVLSLVVSTTNFLQDDWKTDLV